MEELERLLEGDPDDLLSDYSDDLPDLLSLQLERSKAVTTSTRETRRRIVVESDLEGIEVYR